MVHPEPQKLRVHALRPLATESSTCDEAPSCGTHVSVSSSAQPESHLKPNDLLATQDASYKIHREKGHGGYEEGINDGVDGVRCRLQCHDIWTKKDEQERNGLEALPKSRVETPACKGQS